MVFDSSNDNDADYFNDEKAATTTTMKNVIVTMKKESNATDGNVKISSINY